MKVTYDPNHDGLRILFSDAPIERSADAATGLILDYDSNNRIVGLEMTHASQRMPNPRSVEFSERPLPPLTLLPATKRPTSSDAETHES